jgi:predicted O-methyltransferase YrrM
MELALEIDGWMLPEELDWIFQTARSLPPGAQVVEVGSWKGRSTVALCEGLAENETARAWAVDTFAGDPDISRIVGSFDSNEVLAEFRRNTERCACLSLVVSSSVEAANGFEDAALDWVFIDANHTYEAVLADILAWAPKLKDGGLMSGHDFGQRGVTDAVLRSFGEITHGPGALWSTHARPRHRAVIGARKLAHDLLAR